MVSFSPKTCAKYSSKNSKDDRPKPRYSWARWLFAVSGFTSLVWFLIRVVPKPSRATYPCQRMAFPLASGFVVWLLGIFASMAMFKRAHRFIHHSHCVIAGICVTLGVGFIWLALNITSDNRILADDPIPNAPVGQAKGLYPGRVVWVRDPNATNWGGPGDGYPWEPNHTSQQYVDNMVARAIRELAGQNNDSNALDALFRHFNLTHGKGNIGYSKGEKITIKVNLTTCNQRLGDVDPNTYNKIYMLDSSDTSPQMIVALLRQLIDKAGAEQSDIAVGDTVTYFPNQWWNICHAAFPDVCYFDCQGDFGRTKAVSSSVIQHWSHGQDPNLYETDYVPALYAEASYIINMAVLKGHGAGITLCGKNHYGSYIRFPDSPGYYDLHISTAGDGSLPGSYRAMVDMMGHPHMGGKTLLYLIDGLYGGYRWQGTPYKFQMSPFNNDWPSSVFVSQDPVAIDSVGLDFLWEEWPDVVRVDAVDDYLHEAAEANNPPSGTFYDPNGDGSGIGSLGVHEHWNNAIDKQYSRNLGNGNGIELISITLAYHKGDINTDGIVDFKDLGILASQWLQPPGTPSADIAPLSPDGIVNFLDFAVIAEHWFEGQ